MVGRLTAPGPSIAGGVALAAGVALASLLALGSVPAAGSPTTVGNSVSTVRQVAAAGETVVMPGAAGDVADDVAIWRDPEHPEQSLIVGDNKADAGGGLAVYRLDGSIAHYETTGKIGNVDLRSAGVGSRSVVLVGANDRSSDTIRFWSLDTAQATLTPLEARALPTGEATYGFCLGRDAASRHTYAFVTARDSGLLQQYELWTHDGLVDAAPVRAFDVGSVSESCAVDDATGSLYVGEEAAGLWRYDVDPATGPERTAIDRVGGGHLAADVEGIAVVRGADGSGSLVVSSQGDSTFAVYDADGQHAFRGRFTVAGNGLTGEGAVDGASGTDGLDAASGDFGSRFPHGLLVVHDAGNENPGGGVERASNLKLIPLDAALTPEPPASS